MDQLKVPEGEEVKLLVPSHIKGINWQVSSDNIYWKSIPNSSGNLVFKATKDLNKFFYRIKEKSNRYSKPVQLIVISEDKPIIKLVEPIVTKQIDPRLANKPIIPLLLKEMQDNNKLQEIAHKLEIIRLELKVAFATLKEWQIEAKKLLEEELEKLKNMLQETVEIKNKFKFDLTPLESHKELLEVQVNISADQIDIIRDQIEKIETNLMILEQDKDIELIEIDGILVRLEKIKEGIKEKKEEIKSLEEEEGVILIELILTEKRLDWLQETAKFFS